MDSRAEEADDITKALFAAIGNTTSAAATPPPPPNPAPMIAALNQLLKKYRSCALEKYETQVDLETRGFPHSPPAAPTSGLTSTAGLQPRDVVTCVAGNQCSLIDRTNGLSALQAQANRGDPTNFQMNLERIIPKDCSDCAKHQEMHTKHVHCAMEAGGTQSDFAHPGRGPYFEGCKAGVDVEALANSVIHDIGVFISNVSALVPPAPPSNGGSTIATNRATVPFTSCPNPAGGCPESCDNPDFVAISKAYGIHAELMGVDAVAGLKVPPSTAKSLARFLQSPEPELLVFECPKEANVYPMVPAGAALSEMVFEDE